MASRPASTITPACSSCRGHHCNRARRRGLVRAALPRSSAERSAVVDTAAGKYEFRLALASSGRMQFLTMVDIGLYRESGRDPLWLRSLDGPADGLLAPNGVRCPCRTARCGVSIRGRLSRSEIAPELRRRPGRPRHHMEPEGGSRPHAGGPRGRTGINCSDFLQARANIGRGYLTGVAFFPFAARVSTRRAMAPLDACRIPDPCRCWLTSHSCSRILQPRRISCARKRCRSI